MEVSVSILSEFLVSKRFECDPVNVQMVNWVRTDHPEIFSPLIVIGETIEGDELSVIFSRLNLPEEDLLAEFLEFINIKGYHTS